MKENKLLQEQRPDYRFIGGGNGQPATVGEIIDALSGLPRDAVIDNPSRYVLSVYSNDEFNNSQPKYSNNPNCDFANTMAEHVILNYGGINTPKDYENLYCEFIDSEYSDDNTAMTRVDKRGPVNYFPDNYQATFPVPMRYAIDIQRKNNTNFIKTMLEIDRQAIEQKAMIDMEAANKKYELMAEYNVQCNMHNMGAIMCQIVAEDVSKK